MHRLAWRKPFSNVLQKTVTQPRNRRFNNINGLPPNAREAGFGKVVFILSPIITVGGVVAYAKYDKDFRKMVEKNVPGSETIIKVALQEENPLKEPYENLTKQFSSFKKSFDDTTSTITGFFGSSAKDNSATVKKTEEVKPVKATTGAAPKTTVVTSKTTSIEPKPSSKTISPAETVEVIKPKVAENIPNDIKELESGIELAAALALQEYNTAIKVLKNFNETIRSIVDQAVENMDPTAWSSLRNKTSARDSAVETAEKLAREALEKIEKYEVALSKVAEASNHDLVVSARNKIKSIQSHISKVKDELYEHKDLAAISEKYWRSVEKARNYFVEEIESIFPGLNLADKRLKMSPEDLDLFIIHAYSHVLAYQKELQRLQTDGEMRLKRAIDSFRGDSESEAIKAQLDYHLEAEKRKLAIENQKRIFQIRANAEKQLRQQLKQQAEAHMDHLKDAVQLKENEIKRNYNHELEDKLAAEKANYKLQLAGMLGKMRGMDAALQARAESERSAHQAQALWAACQALWSTVRAGEPGVHWKSKLRPLRSEIKAVERAAEGDELVAVVIGNLPREAGERGVFPEDALRERFINVEKVARKVALVPENGASIPTYILSYLQSLFILRPDDPITKDELQNKQFDYSKLDTYDILNRARYFVDRGDLMQALKYMNLLQGAPRKIAYDWLKETRLLLETQQAANTLMAHAAASGLLYL